MTKKIKICFLIVSTVILFPPCLAAMEDKSVLNVEAKNIIKTFAGSLKPKLKQAIQSGGLKHAINVCAKEAPEIASELSVKTGWDVKRVSLKARNSSNATPDNYEKKVLNDFNQRQTEGEKVTGLASSAIIGNEFRFMKAQGVEGVCLNCHGKEITAEVESELKKHYPSDMATGYSLGEVRGAFSLVKQL